MRILISNDDGIDAFGLSLLADLMWPFSNDITIIAPMDNRSGTGRSLSLKQDIHLADLGQGRYACSGTPADCVMLGLNVVMKDAPPDLVVSGINHGMNAADDIGYSGTIGVPLKRLLWEYRPLPLVNIMATKKLTLAPRAKQAPRLLLIVWLICQTDAPF